MQPWQHFTTPFEFQIKNTCENIALQHQNQELITAHDTINELQRKYEDLLNKNIRLTQDKTDFTKDNVNLLNEINELNHKYKDLETTNMKMDTLNDTNIKLEQEVINLTTTAALLATEKDDLTQRLDKTKCKLDASKQHIKIKAREIRDLTNDLEATDEDRERLLAKHNHLVEYCAQIGVVTIKPKERQNNEHCKTITNLYDSNSRDTIKTINEENAPQNPPKPRKRVTVQFAPITEEKNNNINRSTVKEFNDQQVEAIVNKLFKELWRMNQ